MHGNRLEVDHFKYYFDNICITKSAIMYTVAILFIAFLIQLFYFRIWKYKCFKNIPSLTSCPITSGRNIDDMFDRIVSINRDMGPVVIVWNNLITPKVMVADVDVAHAILSSTNAHLGKTKIYEHMTPFLGNGLGTSGVHLWKKDRKLANPAFNLQLMDAYSNIFEYHGNELIDILKQGVNKKSIDLMPFIDLYALDIICESVADVKTHLQRKADAEYLNARSTFMTIVMNRMVSFFKGYNIFFKLTKEYKAQKKCAEVLNNFSIRLINQNNKTNIKNTTETSDKFRNILDIFLESGLNLNRIIEHLNTFIVTGHDTSATIIAFALYEIARNPGIQKKVLDESIKILGRDKDAVITAADSQELVYLEAVIKETLRYYPGISFIERKTERELLVGKIVIPSDVEVSINIYGLHHNEKYFENAHKFIPDRFLAGTALRMNSAAFIPFSKGPRDCIAKTFAMLQMKSAISKVIRNFELLPADPKHKLVLTSEFVLKSTTGVKVQLRDRHL